MDRVSGQLWLSVQRRAVVCRQSRGVTYLEADWKWSPMEHVPSNVAEKGVGELGYLWPISSFLERTSALI